MTPRARLPATITKFGDFMIVVTSCPHRYHRTQRVGLILPGQDTITRLCKGRAPDGIADAGNRKAVVYRAGRTPEWLICALRVIPAFNEPAVPIRRLREVGGRQAN